MPSVIEKTAKFLGKNLTSDDVASLTNHLSFANMKKNPAVNYEDVVEFNKKLKLIESEGTFIRSGKVDQWKADMTTEIIKEFDNWTNENAKNTGLLL